MATGFRGLFHCGHPQNRGSITKKCRSEQGETENTGWVLPKLLLAEIGFLTTSSIRSNYRGLLETADQIVKLDAQTNTAETQISELGRRCRPLKTGDIVDAQNRPRASVIAQLSFLQRCLFVITPQLQHSAILVCAKVLVLSRLLCRSISTTNADFRPLNTFQERTTFLRRRMLLQIDRKFTKSDITQADLVEIICAFCLITNSSSEDALEHFQHLRLQALRRGISSEDNRAKTGARVLRYFIKSIRLSRTFLGYRVPDALRLLQAKPLLRDQDLQTSAKLEQTDLVSLIPPEIQTYVPFVKRAESSGDVVQAWSKTAFVVVIEGLKHSLGTITDVTTLFDLRTEWFSIWLPVYFSSDVLPGAFRSVQEIFNERIVAVGEQQVKSLGNITESMLRTLATKSPAKSLWASEFVLRHPKDDARGFIRELQSRRLGLSNTQRSVVQKLDHWVKCVKKLETQIANSRNIRWRDRLEEPEGEQEDTANSVMHSLTTKDPERYSQAIQRHLDEARTACEMNLAQALARDGQDQEVCYYILLHRVLRESARSLAPAFADRAMANSQRIAIDLQHKLAMETAERLAEQMEGQSLSNHDLDKDASAPTNLPSPRTTKCLKRLCAIMEDIGGVDVWSLTAVNAVKEAVTSRIFEPKYKDHYMQNAFDADYLRAALRPQAAREHGLANGETQPDPKALEYWKRTQLFFGLLI